MACGNDHTVALNRGKVTIASDAIRHCAWLTLNVTAPPQLLTWGSGSHGQLGHGDVHNAPTPSTVQQLEGCHIVQVRG